MNVGARVPRHELVRLYLAMIILSGVYMTDAISLPRCLPAWDEERSWTANIPPPKMHQKLPEQREKRVSLCPGQGSFEFRGIKYTF